MFAFEGLHPGHLVGTHRLFALLRETRSVLIQGADGFDRLVAVFIDRRGQPIADEMGVEIPFFLTDGRRVGVKSASQCRAA